eukprot:GFYU01001702.1.p1 GENE.GFYU01001702.1~~GFYU01001702.1.p1  ORF type:complete len:575 (-),score=99.47 GFYU01001702.1:172-1896(-)
MGQIWTKIFPAKVPKHAECAHVWSTFKEAYAAVCEELVSSPSETIVQFVFDCLDAAHPEAKTWQLTVAGDASVALDESASIALFRSLQTLITSKSVKTLNGLSISEFPLTDALFASLLSCLPYWTTLNSIDFANVEFGPARIRQLCEVIKRLPAVHEIGFEGCNAGDEGAERICTLLGLTPSIHTVNLSQNGVTMKTVKKILDLATKSMRLREVDLEDQSLKSDSDYVDAIAKMSSVTARNAAVGEVLDTCFQKATSLRTFKSKMQRYEKSLQMSLGEGALQDKATLYKSIAKQKQRMSLPRAVECSRFDVGFCDTSGPRNEMQDTYLINGCYREREHEDLFGVFDGHGSKEPAVFLAHEFGAELSRRLTNMEKNVNDCDTTVEECIASTYRALNYKMSHFSYNGSTALVLYIANTTCYVSNCGDTRAVLSKDGKAVRVSIDHKPSDPDEYQRVVDKGGFVNPKTMRVNDSLKVTRAFGDAILSPVVTAEPSLKVMEICADDEFMVIGSDGLWDVLTDDDAVLLASSAGTAQIAANRLLKEALDRGTTDNVTVVVVTLQPNSRRPTLSNASSLT